MKHAVIIIFSFSNKSVLIERLKYFKLVIECLKNQTVQNFELILLVKYESELIRKTLNYPYKEFDNIDKIRDYCKENKINIQTRTDSDDLFVDNYLETIQRIYNNNKPFKNSMIVHFNHQEMDISNFKLLPKFWNFTKDFTSGFISVFTDNNDIFVYDEKHQDMGKLTDRTINMPNGYIFYSQHKYQISKRKI